MSELNFPLLEGDNCSYPKEAVCPWCKKNKVLEPHSFATLSAGIPLSDKDLEKNVDYDAFFHIAWHGAHDGGIGKDPEIGAFLEIVKDVKLGQFDLFFCSTECLRSFLNYCVDELERRVEIERKKSANRK